MKREAAIARFRLVSRRLHAYELECLWPVQTSWAPWNQQTNLCELSIFVLKLRGYRLHVHLLGRRGGWYMRSARSSLARAGRRVISRAMARANPEEFLSRRRCRTLAAEKRLGALPRPSATHPFLPPSVRAAAAGPLPAPVRRGEL